MARFLGNTKSKEVHDTDNEQTNCQISEIKSSKIFSSLKAAKKAGYDPCAHCLSGSTR